MTEQKGVIYQIEQYESGNPENLKIELAISYRKDGGYAREKLVTVRPGSGGDRFNITDSKPERLKALGEAFIEAARIAKAHEFKVPEKNDQAK